MRKQKRERRYNKTDENEIEMNKLKSEIEKMYVYNR